MESYFVLIKEITPAKTAKGAEYLQLVDGMGEKWNYFQPYPMKLEVGKGYVFRTEQNGQYKNIREVEPLANVFKLQALKELANKSDYKRDLFMSLSYAKDLAIAGKISPADNTGLFSMAWQMYEWVNQTAEKLMPKEETK